MIIRYLRVHCFSVINLFSGESYSLQNVAKLYRSVRLKDAMDKIEYFSSKKRQGGMDDLQGPVEADPEYLLIVEANNLAAQIDDEIGMFH